MKKNMRLSKCFICIQFYMCCITMSWATTPGEWNQQHYQAALETMGATDLVNTYSGKGTAIVHFEKMSPRLDAVHEATGEFVFGECENTEAPASSTAATGWRPGGDDCSVEWVMCFDRLYELSDDNPELERRVRRCKPLYVQQVEYSNHATATANGIANVAPDAKIIAIQIRGSEAFKYAVEWLLRPSADIEWHTDNGYTLDEANYYNAVFGGASPAKYWNVVATTASINGLLARRVENGSSTGNLIGAFSKPCSWDQNPDHAGGLEYHEHLLDWYEHYKPFLKDTKDANEFERQWKYFDTHSQILQDAGIMPFFGGHNYLWDDPKTTGNTFVTSAGMQYPACSANTFGVSSIGANYQQARPRAPGHYILSNSAKELTDFLVPAWAGSFGAPTAAAAVAVLKSQNLDKNATIDEVLGHLQQTNLPEGPSHVSCQSPNSMRESYDPAAFPAAAHPSLDCSGAEPYSLPVLDLSAAIESALGSRAK